MTYLKKALPLVAVLGLSTLSIQAFAADPADTIMKSVTFSQQDLTTTQGVASVHKRVVRAATDVCADNSIRSRHSSRAIKQCAIELTDKALAPNQYAVLQSYNNVAKNSRRNWSVEKFQTAQEFTEPAVTALP